MAVRKKDNIWIADIRPHGAKGKRITRKFTTKAEAIRFESFVIAQSVADKDWNPSQKDSRRLSELITIWRDEHSVTITGGRRYELMLNNFCKAVNDPVASDLNSQVISKWRSQRLVKLKASTVNTELIVVKGLFNWLRKRKYISYMNPAAEIENIKVQEQERPYLGKEQIQVLMDDLPLMRDQQVAAIVQTCLKTGCRWSEAENLTRDRVKKDRVIFVNTKSKKKRAVPIRAELADKLLSFSGDKLFGKCGWNATRYLNALLDLPKGISTHILRHTFASHFVMGGGNLLTLQRILGHSHIEMTMRYAHLAPEHLEDALSLNPVSQMERKWKS